VVEIKPVDELELWNRPAAGHVAPWVCVVVALAAITGVVVVGAATWTLWRLGGHVGYTDSGSRWLAPCAMAMALMLVFLPEGSTSRFLRLAVAMPVIHACALVIALLYIPTLDMPALGDRTPMMTTLPVVPAFAIGGAVFVAIARGLGGRREWAHAFVMLALAFLLLLGLWLPIAARFPVQIDDRGYCFEVTYEVLRTSAGEISLLVLAPPFVVTVLSTALELRVPRLARALRPAIIVLSILLLGVSFIARIRATWGAFLVHDNFIHVLLAAAAIAIVATTTLAGTTWLAGRRELRRLECDPRQGTIIDDESVPADHELAPRTAAVDALVRRQHGWRAAADPERCEPGDRGAADLECDSYRRGGGRDRQGRSDRAWRPRRVRRR